MPAKKLLLRVTKILLHDLETGEIEVTGMPVNAAGTAVPGARITLTGFSARGWMTGEILEAIGDFKIHTKWGRVFAATEARPRVLATPEQAAEFVASNVKGMGLKTAADLLEKIGGLPKFYEMVSKAPQQFFDHVPAKIARAILSVDWLRIEHDSDLLAIFRGAKVNLSKMRRIIKHFGASAAKDVIFTNPYQLCEVRGIGFSTAEAVAVHVAKDRKQPFDRLAKHRLLFGLVAHANDARNHGHTCTPVAKIMKSVTRFLDIPSTPETQALLEAAKKEAITRKLLHEEYGHVYSIGLYRAEKGVADNLVRLMTHPVALSGPAKQMIIKKLKTTELDEFQQAGVLKLMESRIGILTGGPGTGKTTVAKRLAEVAKMLKMDILACAPTGKAAKRLAQVAGVPATTMHKALNLRGGDDEGADVDSRDALASAKREFLRAALIFVDESSMNDIFIMRHLLHRIKSGASMLVFIGDVNQLPSIGPGETFRDMIETDAIPVVRLEKVYRVEGKDPTRGIVAGAYAINEGKRPVFDTDGLEFRHFNAKPVIAKKQYANATDAQAAEMNLLTRWILEAAEQFPAKLGVDPFKDVQVLTATLAGPLGVETLNHQLQGRLNPDPTGRAPTVQIGSMIKYFARAGDKVLNTENDDDLGVTNGDVGRIVSVHTADLRVVVRFDDRETPVTFRGREQLAYLSLGYCYTIHKSQGSEYAVTLIPVHSVQGNMLYRQLYYTGVTRGKKCVAIFGDDEGEQRAVTTSLVGTRAGFLKERIVESLGALRKRAQTGGPARRLVPLGLLD